MGLLDRLLRSGASRSGRAASASAVRGDHATDLPVGEDAGRQPDRCAEGDRLLASGSPQQALNAYQAAIDGEDDCTAGHVGQARAYVALNRIEDACDSLEIALAIDPDCVAALQLLAQLRSEAGCGDEAVALLERAVAIAPGRADLHFERGLALNRTGRVQDAAQAYREAMDRDPLNPGPRVNLGLICLQQFGDPLAAEKHFRDALQVEPGHVAAIANLGLALQDQRRYDEAIALYREGLREHPGHVELCWNEGLAHLSVGDYERGWPGYELRFMRSGGRKLDRFPYSEWDGQPVPHAGVLVLGEQGIGDEIMFASCLPDMRAKVGRVVLECAPRLEKLFARSFDGIAVHGKERGTAIDWLRQYPDLKVKTAIGSLPRFLRNSPDAFPARRGYLVADPERVELFRHRLRAAGAGLNVGISWRGGTAGTRGLLRSFDLEHLQPLLAVPNARFFSLQHAIRVDEREQARAAGVVVWDGTSDDLDDTAALVSALDLTITVANTNAHLAGALGRPAWVLLNATPDWRWLQTGERSPWYPSLQLFRSQSNARWAAVIDALAQRLPAVAGGRRAESG
jgi:tetratricopeptide (TPR) repeat protein